MSTLCSGLCLSLNGVVIASSSDCRLDLGDISSSEICGNVVSNMGINYVVDGFFLVAMSQRLKGVGVDNRPGTCHSCHRGFMNGDHFDDSHLS